jgi:serine/threonine protein kinase
MQVQKWKPGDKIKNGRFEILRELGEGGFGVTYLANDHVEEREVVIKTLNVEQQGKKDFPENQQRFSDEGIRLWGFNHPHIVKIYGPVKNNGLLGFVMEYIPGQDLEKYVKNRGGLNEPEALLYIDQIAQALHYVHQEDLHHRDVNPRNIMLRREPQEAVLIDFGLAREFVELEPIYLTNTYGSELYKPVEQYEKRGIFGPPTDIYALAVTLYHLLAGAPPGGGGWASASYTSIVRKKNHERGMGEECDRELWAELINVGVSDRTLIAIQAGMAIEPEDRPKNMTEFRQLLGLLPAATPLQEMPILHFSEPLVTAETIRNLTEPLIITRAIIEDSISGLSDQSTEESAEISIEEFAVSGLSDQLTEESAEISIEEFAVSGLSDQLTEESAEISIEEFTVMLRSDPDLVQDVARQLGIETTNPQVIIDAVITQMQKQISQAEEESVVTISNQASLSPPSNQRPSKKTSSISRRLILQGLLGTGGLAGFGLVGLLLKNLFESQSTFKLNLLLKVVLLLH